MTGYNSAQPAPGETTETPFGAPESDDGDRPAPGGLRHVQAFVNTVDLETGDDDWVDPPTLARWLSDNELPGGDGRIGGDDLVRARNLREALRELLAGNAGHGVAPEALALLDREAVRAPITVSFGAGGTPALRPARGGLDAAVATILGGIATGVADGTFRRLKVCRSDTCRWAYYDGSKNRSGTWCSMAVCGNRNKGRAYRQRHGGGSGSP